MHIAERILTAFVVIIMAGLVLVPTAQVIMRGVFVLPFIGAEEFTRFLLICLIFCAYPLVVQNGENIVMGEFKAAMPARLRGIVNLSISILGDHGHRLHRLCHRDQHLAEPDQRDADAWHPVLDLPWRDPVRLRRSSIRPPPSPAQAAAGRHQHRGLTQHGVRGRHRLPSPVPARLPGGLRHPAAVHRAMSLIEGLPLGLLAQRITYALDSFPLVAVPLFIFVGNLMNLSGITDRIFRFAYTLVGRIPGGLAQVNVFGSLIFSGMSGAALADIGGLGRIEIDAMKKRGFDPAFAGAVTGASATLGPIFPPSIPLIVYGSVTSVSIVQLLVAGHHAGAGLHRPADDDRVHRGDRPQASACRAPAQRPREMARAFLPALPAIVAPALMIAGMTLGIFTPTEAAAMTAVYVILISAFIYRELTLAHLWNSAVLTARSSSAILIIVAAAALFGWILAVEQVPQTFAAALLGLSKDPLMLLIIANLIFFVAGMFLDSTTATLLLVPIIAPPLVMAGVDPVQLGIVTIFNLMLGLLTPPMGLSLFLVADIAKISIRQLLWALLPFYIPLLTTLAILTFAKDFTLWLPRMIAQ